MSNRKYIIFIVLLFCKCFCFSQAPQKDGRYLILHDGEQIEFSRAHKIENDTLFYSTADSTVHTLFIEEVAEYDVVYTRGAGHGGRAILAGAVVGAGIGYFGSKDNDPNTSGFGGAFVGFFLGGLAGGIIWALIKEDHPTVYVTDLREYKDRKEKESVFYKAAIEHQ
jgi:hypothetical protein